MMEKASDILKTLFDRSQQESGRLYSALFKSWERIAGERVAAHSRVRDIRAGIAVVEVDHPGWLQLLQLSQGHILDELRRQFPELGIRGLRLQLPLDQAASAGAKDAGVTTFIDRQLTGPYGGHDWLYMQGPFADKPLPSQGLQSPLVPRQQYRLGLAALEAYCNKTYGGRGFVQLNEEEQVKLIGAMEKGEVQFEKFSSRMLFAAIYANTVEGYFADPIYGGNRDMVGWKLVGFPGTRYDYRDVIANPNQAYTLPPVALQGRPTWGGQ